MDLEERGAPNDEPIPLKDGLGLALDQISSASSRYKYSVGLSLLQLKGGDPEAYSILMSKGKTYLVLAKRRIDESI